MRESSSAANPGVFDSRDATYYGFAVGSSTVRVYLVDQEVDVSRLTSRVATDGWGYRTSAGADVSVSWIGRPHFFERDNIIVLYIEEGFPVLDVSTPTDRRILGVLTSYMGRQFAGNR